MAVPFRWISLVVLQFAQVSGDVAVDLDLPTSSVQYQSATRYAIDRNTSTCFSSRRGAGQDLVVPLRTPAVVSYVRLCLPPGYVFLSVSSSCNSKYQEHCDVINENLEQKQWLKVSCRGRKEWRAVCVLNKNGQSSQLEICEIEVYAASTRDRDIVIYRTTSGRSWPTSVYKRTTSKRWITGNLETSTSSPALSTNDFKSDLDPSSASTTISKTAIIASGVMVTVLTLACAIVFIIIVQKRKAEPIVVVLNRDDPRSGSVACNENEYSAINFEAIVPANFTMTCHPPLPCPPSSTFSKSRELHHKKDLQRPPPYYQPLTQSTPPGDSISIEKMSPVYESTP